MVEYLLSLKTLDVKAKTVFFSVSFNDVFISLIHSVFIINYSKYFKIIKFISQYSIWHVFQEM